MSGEKAEVLCKAVGLKSRPAVFFIKEFWVEDPFLRFLLNAIDAILQRQTHSVTSPRLPDRGWGCLHGYSLSFILYPPPSPFLKGLKTMEPFSSSLAITVAL